MTEGYQMFDGQLSISSFKPIRKNFFCEHIKVSVGLGSSSNLNFKCAKYGYSWQGKYTAMKDGCADCDNIGNCLECQNQKNQKYNFRCGDCES